MTHDRRRPLLLGLGVSVVIVSGLMLWSAVNTIQEMVEHERVIEAMHLMAEVIAASMNRTGRWPTSESELAEIGPITVGGSTWPNDRAAVLKRVVIDYEISVEDVASETVERFRALRPADPDHDSVATRSAFQRLQPSMEHALRTKAQP